MYTRIYLLLIAVRLYFALSPSYIHPDENFQGPESVAGKIFSYPHHLTWEFLSGRPVRSTFLLWLVYGTPMVVLRWLWTGISGTDYVPPRAVYYTLRTVMFMSSFVLEDWAIHDLVRNPRQRRLAVILVASSYVTWTYQTHTLSNSVETILVLWSLVFIQKILDAKERSSILTCLVLGSLIVLGTFNRISFPVFVLLPGLPLLAHFLRKPLSFLGILLGASTTTLVAIVGDTLAYHQGPSFFDALLSEPVVTPYNFFLYNIDPANLAKHGTHNRLTHLLVNVPLLLGPALLLLFPSASAVNPLDMARQLVTHPLLSSATLATAVLSLVSHQEPRFLVPIVPLILSCLQLPRSVRATQIFVGCWVVFNAALGLLYGRHHQAGVVPVQMWIGEHKDNSSLGVPGSQGTRVLWWKTYSPPVWLADASRNWLDTVDMMGAPPEAVAREIQESLESAPCRITSSGEGSLTEVRLVAPRSRREPEAWKASMETGSRGGTPDRERRRTSWQEVYRERSHVGLDDMDPERDGGVLATAWRNIFGRRGLSVWRITRACSAPGGDGNGSSVE